MHGSVFEKHAFVIIWPSNGQIITTNGNRFSIFFQKQGNAEVSKHNAKIAQ